MEKTATFKVIKEEGKSMEKYDLLDVMHDRHSVKLFDPSFKISHEEMDQMINEATSAPSSINMQPWRIVVVESDEKKNELRPLVAFNQGQNDSSSAMVLLFGDLQCTKKGDEILSKAVNEGYMSEEDKERVLSFAVSAYAKADRASMTKIVDIDTSLFAMQFMLVAKHHGYDTNPIGGFDHEGLASFAGLDPNRYVPVMIIAIGKQAKEPRMSARLCSESITKYL